MTTLLTIMAVILLAAVMLTLSIENRNLKRTNEDLEHYIKVVYKSAKLAYQAKLENDIEEYTKKIHKLEVLNELKKMRIKELKEELKKDIENGAKEI